MVSANRNLDFHYRNDGFLIPEYWLSSTGMVALKVRTGGSNRAGILRQSGGPLGSERPSRPKGEASGGRFAKQGCKVLLHKEYQY